MHGGIMILYMRLGHALMHMIALHCIALALALVTPSEATPGSIRRDTHYGYDYDTNNTHQLELYAAHLYRNQGLKPRMYGNVRPRIIATSSDTTAHIGHVGGRSVKS
jgi:hypothetical protein